MSKRERRYVVTEASISRDEEHKSRQRRYMLTMAARVVFLVVAALVARHNMVLGIIIGALSAVLPGFAVVMANDGPPKKKSQRLRGVATPERALTSAADAPTADRRVITADSVVIDEHGATVRPEQGSDSR